MSRHNKEFGSPIWSGTAGWQSCFYPHYRWRFCDAWYRSKWCVLMLLEHPVTMGLHRLTASAMKVSNLWALARHRLPPQPAVVVAAVLSIRSAGQYRRGCFGFWWFLPSLWQLLSGERHPGKILQRRAAPGGISRGKQGARQIYCGIWSSSWFVNWYKILQLI